MKTKGIMQTKSVQIGETVIIRTLALGDCKTKVFNIEHEAGRTRLDLDWGNGQTSIVFSHDEGSVWHRLSNFN